MAKQSEIAKDIKKEIGAMVSVSDLVKYSKMSRDWWEGLLQGVDTIGNSTGKRYFYLDVAARLAKYK